MSNFWNTIDNNYFSDVKNDEILGKLDSIHIKRSSMVDVKFESCLSKPLVEKIERVFKKDRILGSLTALLSQKSYQNFLKHYVVSLLSYANILQFIKKRISPCDSCLEKVFAILAEKYNYTPNFLGEDRHDLRILEKESKALDSIISKKLPLFCHKCLASIKGKCSPSKIRNASVLTESKTRLKTNTYRMSSLILALNKRVTNENKLISKISIAFEIEVQKEYLFTSLIRIEQKLLADNVYKINSVYKNQMAEVEFIGYPTPYTLTLDELKFLNNFRENSLFKIHKVAFKCHNSFYSFNVH